MDNDRMSQDYIELTFRSIDAWESVGPRFAELIEYVCQVSAESFAADLAIHGATPSSLRMMAKRWHAYDFEPPEFSRALEMLADDVHRLSK
jgi:hypothetical protein